MTPLVSQLWPQFMADPDFASCFGRVVVEHAQMLRQERQVIFTLRSAAPLDRGLCARLLASLQPDYEGFELRIQNLFGYATLDEAALRELMEEMKRDGVPINGFLDRCTIQITGQNITIGVCHGTKFLQEMQFERLLAERIAAHTGVKPKVTLESSVGEAEQRQMEEKLERKIAPPVVKFERKNTAPSIKVAVMGCVVNGPGEAREADIGIAGGKGEAVLFVHGNPVKKLTGDNILDQFMEEIYKL